MAVFTLRSTVKHLACSVCKSQARMAEGAGFMAGRRLAFGDSAASVIYEAVLQSERELIWRGRGKKKKKSSEPSGLKVQLWATAAK